MNLAKIFALNKKRSVDHIALFTFGIGLALFALSDGLAAEFAEEDLDAKIHGSIIIGTGIGYRADNLDWNIAGDQYGRNPNILSELEFKDIEIYQAGVDVSASVNRICFRASLYVGEIVGGAGTDSDYLRDDRNALYSRSEFEVTNDDVRDMNAGIGYQFDLFAEKLKFIPLIGVSYHEQNLRITTGVQTVGSADLEGLNSTYETEWRSCWIGMDITFEVMTNLFFSSSLEYHRADYAAKANWNLRGDFQHPTSFAHEADGKGISMKIKISRFFAECWDIGLVYSWQKWSASGGYDRLFLATGETTTSKLNEVNWDSRSINLSLAYRF